jgi:hypothetical protein
MIQLHVLTGAAAGLRSEANHFPMSVGRSFRCMVIIQDPGVFDQHFEIQFSPEGFILQANPHSVVAVNGAQTERALLRNGDVISAGFAKIQFWLGAMTQRSLRLREAAVWLLIIAVAVAQVYLILRLLAIARL